MQTIVYHSKARKTMCGMGTFCLIGMISFQLTMQNGEIENKTVQMAVMYYVNNNIVIADAKTKKVYLTLNLDTNILVADANGWTKNYNLASLIAI